MVKRSKSDSKSKPKAVSSVGRTQWLKGVLELCVLSIVSRGEAYGYEVAQELDLAGLGKIKGGTLYPRLAALEKDGLVEIEWRVGENGPGRKYYRITPEGLVALEQSVQDYAQFASTVHEILQSGPATDGGGDLAIDRPESDDSPVMSDTKGMKL